MLIFHPILVATGSEDEEGQLALYEGRLVAIFVRLAGAEHREERGRLYLEASFGPLTSIAAPTFADLDEAAAWLGEELGPAKRRRRADGASSKSPSFGAGHPAGPQGH